MHTDSQGISENTPTVLKYNYKIQNGDIRCYKELNAARNNGCVFHIDQKLKRNRPWIQDIRKTHFRSGCNLSKHIGAPGVDIDFRQRLNFEGEGLFYLMYSPVTALNGSIALFHV